MSIPLCREFLILPVKDRLLRRCRSRQTSPSLLHVTELAREMQLAGKCNSTSIQLLSFHKWYKNISTDQSEVSFEEVARGKGPPIAESASCSTRSVLKRLALLTNCCAHFSKMHLPPANTWQNFLGLFNVSMRREQDLSAEDAFSQNAMTHRQDADANIKRKDKKKFRNPTKNKEYAGRRKLH